MVVNSEALAAGQISVQ